MVISRLMVKSVDVMEYRRHGDALKHSSFNVYLRIDCLFVCYFACWWRREHQHTITWCLHKQTKATAMDTQSKNMR